MKFSASPYRPLHLYTNEMWYFITAPTYQHNCILSTNAHFHLWIQALKKLTREFQLKLKAWVVLPNHYHLLFLPKTGRDIGTFMKRLNGRTSRELNLLDKKQGRSVWYSYWDTCVRDERGFWTHFNYIHYNPIKHGYVREPEEWEFSNYCSYLREGSKGWLTSCREEYPLDEEEGVKNRRTEVRVKDGNAG